MKRVKYLLFFSVALLSAMATYKTFFMFKGEAIFAVAVPFINTVILLLIWGISFSAKSDFVRKNNMLMIAIPLVAIHFSNFITHLTSPLTTTSGFLLYVVSSTSLVFFSYKASILEAQFDEKQDPIKTY